MAELQGVVFEYGDTGNNGIDWAFHDERFTSYVRLDPRSYLNTGGEAVYDVENLTRAGQITAVPDEVAAANKRSVDRLREYLDARPNVLSTETGTREVFGLIGRGNEAAQRAWHRLTDKVVTVTWYDGQQEARSPHTLRRQLWSYGGLRLLKTGDELTIYDREDMAEVVWSGPVKLSPRLVVGMLDSGAKTHQVGVKFAFWQGLFRPQSPATLAPREA